MSTHYICFHGEIRKISAVFAGKKCLIRNYVYRSCSLCHFSMLVAIITIKILGHVNALSYINFFIFNIAGMSKMCWK